MRDEDDSWFALSWRGGDRLIVIESNDDFAALRAGDDFHLHLSKYFCARTQGRKVCSHCGLAAGADDLGLGQLPGPKRRAKGMSQGVGAGRNVVENIFVDAFKGHLPDRRGASGSASATSSG